jgi:hypothetical protein
MKLKLSLCNEVLQPLPFERQCALAASQGYTGLEVAPFTLADDPGTLDDAAARRIRTAAHSQGLAISSLHWLLVKPAGLSLVTPDAALRARTLGLLQRLIGFAAAVARRCWCMARPRSARLARARAWPTRRPGLKTPGHAGAAMPLRPAWSIAWSRCRPWRHRWSTPWRRPPPSWTASARRRCAPCST